MAVWSRLIGDGNRLREVGERVDDGDDATVSLAANCLVGVAEHGGMLDKGARTRRQRQDDME